MPYLSREEIEQIADGVIRQYKNALVPEKHLCYHVDPSREFRKCAGKSQ